MKELEGPPDHRVLDGMQFLLDKGDNYSRLHQQFQNVPLEYVTFTWMISRCTSPSSEVALNRRPREGGGFVWRGLYRVVEHEGLVLNAILTDDENDQYHLEVWPNTTEGAADCIRRWDEYRREEKEEIRESEERLAQVILQTLAEEPHIRNDRN